MKNILTAMENQMKGKSSFNRKQDKKAKPGAADGSLLRAQMLFTAQSTDGLPWPRAWCPAPILGGSQIPLTPARENSYGHSHTHARAHTNTHTIKKKN